MLAIFFKEYLKNLNQQNSFVMINLHLYLYIPRKLTRYLCLRGIQLKKSSSLI